MEADANPHAIVLSSDESTSLDNHLEVNLNPALSSETQDLFKAVHHFSQKDRNEAAFERKKNQHLIDFISAHGLSLKDVNDLSKMERLHI